MSAQTPQLTMEKVWVLVIGDRAWGRGPTLYKALKELVDAGGSQRKYIAYLIHKDSYVDGMGSLTFPHDFPPREIHRVGVKES